MPNGKNATKHQNPDLGDQGSRIPGSTDVLSCLNVVLLVESDSGPFYGSLLKDGDAVLPREEYFGDDRQSPMKRNG
jgi:hypothetical protein